MEVGEHEIVVRGKGEARVLPDRAVLRVEVEGEAADRDDAYQSAARQTKQVDEVIAGFPDAMERVVTAALVVQPKTRWRRGETVKTGWRATRASMLEVRDTARLGDLIAGLVAAGGEVAGPAWQIDPTNVAYEEIRRLAAEDARRRGQAYAAALGLRLAGIAWVAEPGLRQPQGFPVARGGPMGVAMAAGVDAGDEVIDVSPEEVTVEAELEVAFRFTEGEADADARRTRAG